MVFEAWCWSRMQKISCREHSINEELFIKGREQRNFMIGLKKKVNLMIHVLRHNNLLCRVSERVIVGKNAVGRPPLEDLQQIMKDIFAPTYQLKSKAQNRQLLQNCFNNG